MVLLLLIVLLTYMGFGAQQETTSILKSSSPIDKELQIPLTTPKILEAIHTSEMFSFLSHHPNIFILLLLLTFSTLYTLQTKTKTQPQPQPQTLSLPSFEPSYNPQLLSPCTSQETCTTLSDSLSLPSLSSSTFLERFIDNGNFSRSFEILSTTASTTSQQSFIAQHKLDSFHYVIKVEIFEGFLADDRVEQAVLNQVSKYKSLKCSGIARYVTCWVEELTGQVALYVQMEAIEGVTVAEYIQGGVSMKEVMRILRKTAKVLNFFHRQGLAHGNISIQNIFVDKFQKVLIGEFTSSEDQKKDLEDFKIFRQQLFQSVSTLPKTVAESVIIERN